MQHPSLLFGLALALSSLTLSSLPTRAHGQLLERASSGVRDEPRRDDRRDDSSGSSNESSGQLGRASRTARGSGSRSSEPSATWGSASPYYHAYPSAYVASPEAPPPPGGLARTTTRVALDGGFVHPAERISVGRIGASLRVQTTFGLEIAARYSIFVEPLVGRTDSLALGRIGLDWRIITEEVMQFRLGAALRHFHDRTGALFGADIEAGLDFFPIEPLILTFEANVGFLGNALLVQARGSVGLLVSVFEIYLGYNYEGIFGAQNVDLGGPMLGLRFWM